MASRATSISLWTYFTDIPHNIRVFSFCDLLGNFARAMVLPYASLYILALGGNTAQSFATIGDNAEGFVRYRTAPLAPWTELLDRGVWVGPAYNYYKYESIFKTPSRKFEFFSNNLKEALRERGLSAESDTDYLPHYEENRFHGDNVKYPLLLSVYHPVLNI